VCIQGKDADGWTPLFDYSQISMCSENFEYSQELAYDNCHASNETHNFLTPEASFGGSHLCECTQWDPKATSTAEYYH
jgi:hypothetical protein